MQAYFYFLLSIFQIFEVYLLVTLFTTYFVNLTKCIYFQFKLPDFNILLFFNLKIIYIILI
jgi:hypothetical protein